MCGSLRTCCGCQSLEIGAQIISIFSILVALTEIGYCVWAAQALPLAEIKMMTVYIVLAVLSLFELFCASLLTYGTFRKQPSHMWPWIALAWLKALTLLAAAVVVTTALALGALQGNMTKEIAFVVVYVIQAVILMYAACVVNSRRLEIVSESYSDYSPRVTRSNSTVQRVYVPITSYRYND